MAKALKFNPGFQTDTDAIANFVVRQGQFERIIAALVATAEQPFPLAKIMVVAPRGAGKTTLCRRVAAEVRLRPDLNSKWHPIFLGEESYTVTSPGEFFLECLFQLKDQTPEADLADLYVQALAATSEDELLRDTIAALRKYSTDVGKRLLIIVENFHIILQDQIGKSADTLLEALNDVSLFGVLATSVSQGAADEEITLPSDYLTIVLPALTLDECHTLWVALSGREVKPERIRPLQILTGGSPRLLHILAEFMNTPSLRDLMDNLNLLIDQNTEYFKSQLDALPAIERKVFAALLDAWDPCSAKQVAETARVQTNVASAMLARLSERGAVIKEQGKSRGAIYYAAERLFNIYYLMRRRSHPSSRVRALVSFMTEYYDRDELISTTAQLVDEACGVEPARRGDYYSTYNAILSHAPESVRRKIIDDTPDAFFMTSADDGALSRTSKIAIAGAGSNGSSQNVTSEIDTISRSLDDLLEKESYSEAAALAKDALKTHASSLKLWLKLAVIEFCQGNATEVVFATGKLLELDAANATAFAFRGIAHSMLGQDEEAERDFRVAVSHDPSQYIALSELAEIEEAKGNIQEALEFYRRSHETGMVGDHTVAKFGQALLKAGKEDEAERLLCQAAEDPENFFSRRALVDHLDASDRQGEALDVLRKAAKEASDWRGWSDLGSFLAARTEQYEEAETAFRNAIDNGADSSAPFVRLAHVMEHLKSPPEKVREVARALVERIPGNSRAWISAATIYSSIKDTAETEAAFQHAIESDETTYSRSMYAAYLGSMPNRKPDAARVLREAISNPDLRGACELYRALAELMVHDGDDVGAENVISDALEKYKNCTCCRVISGEICTRANQATKAREFFEAALAIDDESVSALTGLARLVDQETADALIARAIAADPDDPRSLLARAAIRLDVNAQIADAEAALELDNNLLEAHLLVSEAKVKVGEIDDAFIHLEDALSLLANQREYIPNFVSTAMSLAQTGHSARVAETIANDEFGPSLEPLSVALKLIGGQNPLVAKEVMEVALDIVAGASRN